MLQSSDKGSYYNYLLLGILGIFFCSFFYITIFKSLYIQTQRIRYCLLIRVVTHWNGFAYIRVRYSVIQYLQFLCCRMYSRWNFFHIQIIAIYCVAGTAASTGTSVRNIDRGNQHDNNTTTHNGFIAYIFFLKWYYSCKLNLKNRLIWAHKTSYSTYPE
jgi:hypothetical protein